MIWEDHKHVAFDFETSGTLPEYALQPWRRATGDFWATSLAVVTKPADRFEVGGCLDPTVADMRRMLQSAIDNGQRLVGWNVVYDISVLLAYGLEELVFQARWLDAMLLWRHWQIEPEYEMAAPKKKSYSLKAYVPEFLPYLAGYEEGIDFHSTDPAERRKLQRYNEKDTVATFLGARHIWGELTPTQQRCVLIEAESLPLIARANLHGMPVDTIACRELQTYLTDVAEQKLAALAPHGITEQVVRSPLKLGKLLFDEWQLPVLKENTSKKTGKVSRSTDKEVLHELAFIDPRAKELREYREALNNRTKFADALLDSAAYNGDGRTHPLAIPFGTYSGRLTYASKQWARKINPQTGREREEDLQTGFALHQQKRDKIFRGSIVAPPGYTLMEFDASGQEFRWMAIASSDPVMLSLCEPGEDPHSYMGARIEGLDYQQLIARVKADEPEAKNARQLGKVGNLSLQYRTSARKLRVVARVQYNLPMELPEAQRIHRTYQTTYTYVPRYWDIQIQRTRRLGYVETFAGRRVQVVGAWDGPNGWSMGSTAINYRIQGTGAEQKYLALAVLKSYLISVGAYFAWDLHDGIYLWVPNDKVKQVAVEAKRLLDNLPYEKAWGFSPPIPLPWDCKAGASWGTLKDFDYGSV